MARDFSDRYKKRKWRLLKVAQFLVPVALVLFVVFQFVVGISAVQGSSMNNTLKDGDLVFYSRLQKNVEKGDIVSVSQATGEYHVKRVVATAGDTVDIRDGKLFINGLEETADYALGKTLLGSKTLSYPLTVSPDHVFVMGDNREDSIDSRTYGEIECKQVTGVLLFRFGFLFAQGL